MRKIFHGRKTFRQTSIFVLSLAFVFSAFLFKSFGQIPDDRPDAAEKRYKPELVIQTGHTSLINSVAITKDGKTLATGGGDDTLRLWDVETGRQIKSFSGHRYYIISVALSRDEKFLASGGFDQTVRVWNIETGRQINLFEGHTDFVLSVAFSPDGKTLASCSRDKTIRLWDLETGKPTLLEGHSDWVFSVVFSPDGATLASTGVDQTVRLWDTKTKKPIKTLEGHTDEVLFAAFSPDGKTLVSAGKDTTVRLWNVAAGNSRQIIENQESLIYSVIFSPDGKTLAIAGNDKINLWNLEKATLVKTLTGHTSYVRSIAFSGDGKTLVSVGSDRAIKLWAVESGEQIKSIEGHATHVLANAFSPDGKTLAGASFDNKIKLWNLQTGEQSKTLESENKQAALFGFNAAAITTLAFSPDGKMLASGDNTDKTIKLWNVETGKLIRSLTGHTSSIHSVAFSPDGKLASGGEDNSVRLWNVETGGGRTLGSHEKGVNAVAFSPDGLTLASGGKDGIIKFWNVAAASEIKSFAAHQDEISSIAFSPDKQTLASASFDKTIKLWSAKNGQIQKTLNARADKINSISFSIDGKNLASADKSGAINLWDVEAGNYKSFQGHTKEISSIAFSPDKNLLASGSWDATIKLWHTDREKCAATLISLDKNDWVVITPDSRFDASQDAQKLMHFVVFDSPTNYEIISLDQLKKNYYLPHLLRDIIADQIKPRSEFSVTLYPKVEITQSKQKNNTLDLKLTNRRGGIGRVEVKINGSEAVNDATGGKYKNSKESEIELHVEIPLDKLQTDINTGEIITWNGEGDVQSRSEKFYLQKIGETIALRGSEIVNLAKEKSEPFDGKFYAVIAGVSDYADQKLKLRFAAKDAEDMTLALSIGARKLFCGKEIEAKIPCERVNLRLLSTETNAAAQFNPPADIKQNFRRFEPTKKNFKAVFAEIAAQAKPEDIVVIYLAGHGTAITDESREAAEKSAFSDIYLYPTSEAATLNKSDLQNKSIRENTTISSLELADWVNEFKGGIRAKKKAVILDTCAAGAVQADLTAPRPPQARDESAEQVRALDRLNERAGLYVLMGSTADAVSYEAGEYSQGLLTYSLLEAMTLNNRLRGEKFLDVEKWFGEAGERVEELAKSIGGIQRPYYIKLNTDKEAVRNFDIGYFDAPEKEKIPLAQPMPVILQPLFFEKGTFQSDERLRLSDKLEMLLSNPPENRSGQSSVKYVNAKKSPKGLSPRGEYTVVNGLVTVEVGLLRDEKPIAIFKVEAAENEIAKKVADEIIKNAGNK